MTTSTQETITKLIAQIEAIEEIVTDEDNSSLPKPFVYRCTVKPPVSWDREVIEKTFQVTLPDDLVALWNKTSGIELYKDISYGQWGLILWSPDETLTGHH
jgi:hypothetical protein